MWMGREEGFFSFAILVFCEPPLARRSTTRRHGNQLKKVSIHWSEAENSVAFVCGECVRKGKEGRDAPVGFLISMAVGADSLRESTKGQRGQTTEASGCCALTR